MQLVRYTNQSGKELINIHFMCGLLFGSCQAERCIFHLQGNLIIVFSDLTSLGFLFLLYFFAFGISLFTFPCEFTKVN